MTNPLLQIPLDIPDVTLEKVVTGKSGDIIITVSSTLKGTPCKKCGRQLDAFHGFGQDITLRHLPIFERTVLIKIRPRRYRCSHCEGGPTTTQKCSWYDFKSPHTKAYDQWLLRDLINSTISDVSMKRRIGKAAVAGVLERHISYAIDWQRISPFYLLGIDEIALKKGHQDYVVIISCINRAGEKTVLTVLPDRKKATVKAFLESLPESFKQGVERVCIDMHEGYLNAVQEALPHASIVVDRFHVAKHYRDCADKARKAETQRLKEELSKEEYAKLKGVMWVFRKPWAQLDSEQQEKLLLLFSYAPDLKPVYIARESLTDIFEKPLTQPQARKAINAWCEHIALLHLTCFDRFIRTLRKWQDQITCYFIRRETSGFVEGLNNKIKVIKRRCYGIFNVKRLFQHIWLDVDGRRLLRYA
jgi:transposase